MNHPDETIYYALFYIRYGDKPATTCLHVSPAHSRISAAMVGAVALQQLSLPEHHEWQPEIEWGKFIALQLRDEDKTVVARLVPERVGIWWTPGVNGGPAVGRVVRDGGEGGFFNLSDVGGSVLLNRIDALRLQGWEE
jgi:hypothetical protein